MTGDAQAFAALAQDPTLAHPEHVDPPAECAYRAQRPAVGLLRGSTLARASPTWRAGHWSCSRSLAAARARRGRPAALAATARLLAVVGPASRSRPGSRRCSELTPELLAAALLGRRRSSAATRPSRASPIATAVRRQR